MTIPIWAPWAALTLICAVCPLPGWVRRIDWPLVAAWLCVLAFCLAVWYGVFRFVWWIA